MKLTLKLLSIFLSALFIIFMCAGVISASALELSADGFSFTRDNNTGEAAIVGFSSNSPLAGESNITIPDTLLGYTVVGINQIAFMDNVNITQLTLNNSLRTIGDSAFYGNTSLQSVTVPSNVTSIGSAAFYNNSSLTAVTFECNRLQEIKGFTFAYDTSLTEVILPENLRTISESAFLNCTSLNKVFIPESVLYIDDTAFKNCPVTVYGYSDSTAQEYADAHGLDFVAVDWNSSYADSLNKKCQSALEALTTNAYKYTPESLRALQDAYNEAVPLLDTVFVTSNQLLSASKAIDTAMNNLVKILYGDIDGNDELELEDAVLAQKALAQIFTLNDEQKNIADIDRNGEFELEDAVLIQKMLAGVFSI